MTIPQRVLLVDDEEDLLFFIKAYLAEQGHVVDCASELEEAEALIANVGYSVVVLDLRLTRFDYSGGMAIIRFIRQRDINTGVIVLTAYGTEAMEAETHTLGADVFLHKPQPLSVIAKNISSLLRERQP